MKKFIVFTILTVFLLSVVVFAAEQNQNFLIGKDQVKDNVVFGAGQTVNNLGTVNNDLFLAGQTINSDGTINGDAFALGQNIIISGPVSGSIRAFGQTLNIKSEVGRNVLMGGQSVSIEKSAIVNGNVLAAGQVVNISGTVNKGLNASAGIVMIDGTIVGDVSIEANEIKITPTAKIDGNLAYKSSKEAMIPEGVVLGQVNKNIIQKPVTPQKVDKNPFGIGNIILKIFWLIGSFLLGTLLIVLFKKYFEKSASNIKSSWAKYLGIGFLTIIVMPIAALILFITILGIPIALFTLILYLLFLYLAKIPVAIFIGDLFIKNKSIYLKLLLGLAILAVIFLIPLLGGLIHFIVILVGLGALGWNTFYKSEVKTEVLD